MVYPGKYHPQQKAHLQLELMPYVKHALHEALGSLSPSLQKLPKKKIKTRGKDQVCINWRIDSICEEDTTWAF